MVRYWSHWIPAFAGMTDNLLRLCYSFSVRLSVEKSIFVGRPEHTRFRALIKPVAGHIDFRQMLLDP
jgi:hypothetical protein